MSLGSAKRFWKQARAEREAEGFRVALDGRALRTPAKALLNLPSQALAEAIASEWDAQNERIDPATMPLTRMANSAIDKVSAQHGEVADLLAAYGGTDLTCYRASGPEALIARQAEGWDPLLDWAAGALGARLVPVTGVMHVAQDAAALSRLSARVHAFTAFELASFHDLVSLSGSLIIGFAAALRHRDPETLWALSRIDETWQEEQWGVDEESAEQAALKKQAFLDAERFFAFLQHP